MAEEKKPEDAAAEKVSTVAPVVDKAVTAAPAVAKPAPKAGAAGAAAAKAAATAGAKPAATVIKTGHSEVVYRHSHPVESFSRRSFMSWLGVGWVSFSAAMGGLVTAATRFMFPNVLFEPPSTFKAGLPNDYALGKVDERWKEAYGVWLVRTEEGFYALSTTCTHLGCTPNWLGAENKFKCPCHGSGFYPTGINFEGPAPRPLERFKISLADDGQILVDKNLKFQQEKGQWESPGAFLDFSA